MMADFLYIVLYVSNGIFCRNEILNLVLIYSVFWTSSGKSTVQQVVQTAFYMYGEDFSEKVSRKKFFFCLVQLLYLHFKYTEKIMGKNFNIFFTQRRCFTTQYVNTSEEIEQV